MKLQWRPRPSAQVNCRSRLEHLQADIDFTTLTRPCDLIAPLAAQRGRAILVITYPLPHYMDGAWLDIKEPNGSHMDVILVAADATVSEQEHAIAHELAHIILGHSTLVGREELLRLMPFIDPDRILSLLCRSTYETVAEQEAETLATYLEVAIAEHRVAPPQSLSWVSYGVAAAITASPMPGGQLIITTCIAPEA